VIAEWLSQYGYFAILAITFLEGESIVILAGIAAYQGLLSLEWVIAAAVLGSFCGDQFYYTIGRRYGAPLLKRWPALEGKIAWAFRLVRKHEIPFILSFRFIYGVRNVSPFVIAMAGVPRAKFMALNLVAAVLWALAFSFGGFYFGKALEEVLGEHQYIALAALAVVACLVGLITWIRKRRATKKACQQANTATAIDTIITDVDNSTKANEHTDQDRTAAQ
jgi:membrane protein DedA with SNARE-associated domain